MNIKIVGPREREAKPSASAENFEKKDLWSSADVGLIGHPTYHNPVGDVSNILIQSLTQYLDVKRLVESKFPGIWCNYSSLWLGRAPDVLISDFVSYGTYLIIPADRGKD